MAQSLVVALTAKLDTLATLPGNLYAPESGISHITTISFTLISLCIAFAYVILIDIRKGYVTPPKHFPKWTLKEAMFKPNVDVPIVRPNPGSKDFSEVLERGARLYPGRPFKMPHHPHEWVILPYAMIDEVRNIPEPKFSFQQGSYDFFMGWHTGITNHERTVATILKTSIQRLIDVCYAIVQDEGRRTVIDQIGECENWTTIKLLPKSVAMVMAISQRIFVGEPLCRDSEWLQSIMMVTSNAFAAVPSLWSANIFTRPLVAWRNPKLKIVREHRDRAERLLSPILTQRLRDLNNPDFKPKPDLMQFVLDATARTGEGRSLEYQVNAIIGTGRAALFTTSTTIFFLSYDLAIRPEYFEPLREEILNLGDVPYTRANVNKLTKLDSFMRECQRFSKFMLVGTLRKVMEPMVLSDGTKLPKGTYVGTNVQDAMFNHSMLPDANVFDGFRWHRMRQEPGKEQMFQSVQMSSDYLTYGMGSQACPGRYFAAHEAKVVLARLILGYDFRLTEPCPGKHPMAHAAGVMTEPDQSVEFEFKRRDWSWT